MGKKYKYEDMKYYIEVVSDSGCKLLSKEYIDQNNKLNLECKCGNPFQVDFNHFRYQNKRQCNECGNINRINNQIKSNDNFIKELKEKNNEIIPLETYKGAKISILVKHFICGHEWYATPDSLINASTSCPQCANRKTTEEFQREINNKYGSNYIVVGKYTNSRDYILMLHKTCGNYFEATPDSILNSLVSLTKDQCPKCSINHFKSTEEFKKEIYDIVGNEYEVLGEYIGARKNILIKHRICGRKYNVTPDSFLNSNSRCVCQSFISQGELNIEKYLINNNCSFSRQFRFSDCKNILPLPFDFSIFDTGELICLIEYDGKQHFEPIEYWGGEEYFKYVKQNDKIKNDYCITNKIPLMRIPYWEFKNINKILDGYFKETQSVSFFIS